MNNFKVLHTFYDGTPFSNETEARWAVFFDSLGVNWEYKTEIFELSKIGQYCPGFVINRNTLHEQWVEVRNFAQTFDAGITLCQKENPPSAFKKVLNKLNAVASYREAGSVLVVGLPYEEVASYSYWGREGLVLTYCPRCGYHSFRYTTTGGIEVGCGPCDHRTPGGGGNLLSNEECHFKDGPVVAHKGMIGSEAIQDLSDTGSIAKAKKTSEKFVFEKIEVSGVYANA